MHFVAGAFGFIGFCILFDKVSQAVSEQHVRIGDAPVGEILAVYRIHHGQESFGERCVQRF